jgi:hypothetical protein
MSVMSIETVLSIAVLIVLMWGCLLGVKRGYFVKPSKEEEDQSKSPLDMTPLELSIRASRQELERNSRRSIRESAIRSFLDGFNGHSSSSLFTPNSHSSNSPVYMQPLGTGQVIIHMGKRSKTVTGQIAGPMQVKFGSWISQYDDNGNVINKWPDPASVPGLSRKS